MRGKCTLKKVLKSFKSVFLSHVSRAKIPEMLLLLEAKGVLVENERHAVESETTPRNQLSVLIDFIGQGPKRNLLAFIDTLDNEQVGCQKLASELKQNLLKCHQSYENEELLPETTPLLTARLKSTGLTQKKVIIGTLCIAAVSIVLLIVYLAVGKGTPEEGDHVQVFCCKGAKSKPISKISSFYLPAHGGSWGLLGQNSTYL